MDLILRNVDIVNDMDIQGTMRGHVVKKKNTQASPAAPLALRRIEDIAHFDPILDAVDAASNIEVLM